MKKRFLLLVIAAGCSSKASGKTAEKADGPPPRAATGSPLAIASAELDGKVIRIKAYNYADKTIGQYSLLVRYYDQSGKRLEVHQGTDVDWLSFGDPMMTCAPKSWCQLHTPGEVPSGATRVEVTTKALTAVAADMRMDDKPLFEIPGTEWPK